MIKEGVQITNLFKKGDTMSTLSIFVKSLAATKLLTTDLDLFTYMDDTQLVQWGNDNMDQSNEDLLFLAGFVACFPTSDASPEEVLAYLCGNMCEMTFTGHNALIVFDVCAKLSYIHYRLDNDSITCKDAFILLCKGSHILRPSKDTLWPAVRQCLSAVSSIEGSGVKPWLPSKPK